MSSQAKENTPFTTTVSLFNWNNNLNPSFLDSQVSVRKIMLSLDETKLVVLTHRNEIIFIDLQNLPKVSDEEIEVKKYPYSIIDIKWNGNNGGIAILSTDVKQQLCILNKNNTVNFPANAFFGKDEYPVAISDVIDGKIIVVSDKRSVIVLEFDENVSFSVLKVVFFL